MQISIVPGCVAIGVFALYVVFLRLGENLESVLSVSHPGVRQDLSCSQTFDRIFLKQACKHISCFFRDAVLQLIISLDNHLLKFVHVVRSKWYNTIEHGVQDDPARPNIDAKSFITLIFEDFRRNVSWSPALLCHYLSPADDFTDTEVANFDLSVR